MEDKTGSMEAPEVFLVKLGEQLRKKEGIDDDLAIILQKHILTANPANDAMMLARAAIIKLAGERAAPPKAQVRDG